MGCEVAPVMGAAGSILGNVGGVGAPGISCGDKGEREKVGVEFGIHLAPKWSIPKFWGGGRMAQWAVVLGTW